MIMSFLSKGFPGLFPLAFFFCYHIVLLNYASLRKIVADTALLLCIFLVLSLLFLSLNHPAREFLNQYINTQVLEGITGQRIIRPRWHIMQKLFTELLIMISITAILLGSYYRTNVGAVFNHKITNQRFLQFFLIGLSASAPIMISLKQLSYYIVPSLPYFAIAFSMLAAPVMDAYISRINAKTTGFRIFRIAGVVLLAIALTITLINFKDYGKYENKLKVVEEIGERLPPGISISISKSLYHEYGLMALFQRKFFISLDRSGKMQEFHLLKTSDPIPAGYHPLDFKLHGFILLRRIQ